MNCKWSNNRIKWVENDIHVTKFVARSYPRNEKEISNILFRKHDHERVAEWFLNSKKTNEVWKWRDLSRSPDNICGDCGKKLRRFRTICHVWPLQTEASPNKNQGVEKNLVRFGVKVTVELRFDFKTFCIGNRQHRLVHVNFL